jgi:cysteine desulfurase/selenocysteine lyase
MTTSTFSSAPDFTALRAEFPLLSREMQGRPLVYLDSAATSQKPQCVLDAVATYYRRHNANVHRGVYELAEEATAAYEAARDRVAGFINAEREETIFVRNATEAINLVAYSWGRRNIGRGDVILLTPLEHHSNLVPWQLLAGEVGAELRYLRLATDGTLDLTSLDDLLATKRVKLLACTYISNVLGSITPVSEMARRVHAHGARLLVDAAQAVPHVPVDVRALDVDFLAFTGHKMMAPMGIGVLYGRRDLLESMPPFLGGGEMIRRVRLDGCTWNDLPWKFEAGTPNVGGAVGLGAAVKYLETVGMNAVAEHDRRLAEIALKRLREVPGITVYGPEERGAVAAFNLDGVHPHDLASLLDEDGIAVRAGHHCAQPLHDHLGIPASTRASFYVYNDEGDIVALLTGLDRAREVLAV